MNTVKNTQRYDKKCSTDEEDAAKLNSQKIKSRKDWRKIGSMPIGDGAEIRNPLFNTIFKKPGFSIPEVQNNSSSDAGSTKQSWQVPSKRPASSYAHDDDDDETYSPTFSHAKSSLRCSVSGHSKLSFNKSLDHDEVPLTTRKYDLEAKPTPTLLMRSNSFRQSNNSLFNEHPINYVTLFGFGIGLLVSKILQYLLVYFNWLLRQVKQLRDVFLGEGSLMDFFNFDDNSRYDLRIKVLIMPLLAICYFLYVLVAMLHYGIRLLLTDVPSFLMALIHKVYLEI